MGCGRGHYVLSRAARRPEAGVIGLDTKRKWIGSIRAQALRLGLANVRAIRCDARHDLPLLFAPGSVSLFTVLHPDPWWKKRHRKRRLIGTEFALLLVHLLRPGGFLFLQTDVPDLAAEAAEILGQTPPLAAVEGDAFFRGHLGGVQSHRAGRCAALGIPVHQLAYRREGPG